MSQHSSDRLNPIKIARTIYKMITTQLLIWQKANPSINTLILIQLLSDWWMNTLISFMINSKSAVLLCRFLHWSLHGLPSQNINHLLNSNSILSVLFLCVSQHRFHFYFNILTMLPSWITIQMNKVRIMLFKLQLKWRLTA